ncbi:MAG: hypothetical protein JXA41_02935 [Deltaproteobacteria bacterium]|nr:hypothetical protein [Deltaproteobacteria bacterium]
MRPVRRLWAIFVLFSVLLIVLPAFLWAEVPQQINYQGYLTDQAGNPVPDGSYIMIFSIYDATDVMLWRETQTVPVTGGVYHVRIGQYPGENPFSTNLFEGRRYLGVKVGTDSEMHPKQPLTCVPFAMKAKDADTLAGKALSEFAANTHNHTWTEIVDRPAGLDDGDNIGITEETDPTVAGSVKDGVSWDEVTDKPAGFADGVDNDSGTITGVQAGDGLSGGGTTGSVTLAVQVPLALSGSDVGYSVISATNSDPGSLGVAVVGYHAAGPWGYLGGNGHGVFGYSQTAYGAFGQSGTSHGVVGYSQGEGCGVKGQGRVGVRGESQVGDGVVGETAALDKSGVYGYSMDGIGVTGRSDNTYGVVGWTGAGSKSGVYGHSTQGTGVYGETGSLTGAGVWGKSTNNASPAVFGDIEDGVAVKGRNKTGTAVMGSSANGTGVKGESAGYGGVAVYGQSQGSYSQGVHGSSTGSSAIGVMGYADDATSIGVQGYGGLYDFYAAGPGTNYAAFTGSHEVKLAENVPETVKPGMLCSVTGETQIRKDSEDNISISSTLPTVTLSSTPNDKTVFGVFVAEGPLPRGHWYDAAGGERFGLINALGEGRVWVSNINGNIKAGDYITTSMIPGYGQAQDDDLLHSYTLGKAIETVDWDTVTTTVESGGKVYKIYLIAVVYTSG